MANTSILDSKSLQIEFCIMLAKVCELAIDFKIMVFLKFKVTQYIWIDSCYKQKGYDARVLLNFT